MKCYKLVDVYTEPVTISVAYTKNGITHYGGLMELKPKQVYKIPDGDMAMETSLKGKTTQKKYTEELESELKRLGIPYKLKVCSACGGRAKQILFNQVEVFEREE